MLEDDAEVAAYRDAVLWTGVLTKLSHREAVSVCKKILAEPGSVTSLIGLGLFLLDDKQGALLAIPRDKNCVKAVTAALRDAGLDVAAKRVARAAR